MGLDNFKTVGEEEETKDESIPSPSDDPDDIGYWIGGN